jgi:acetyl-CoA carboxylase biotin carboxyl carrier protein
VNCLFNPSSLKIQWGKTVKHTCGLRFLRFQIKKEKETERRICMAHNVTAPMVGKIVDIKVKVGDKVKEDDEIAVLEAMKMEMPIVAPASGVVKEIKVSVGQTCETDMVLAVIE